MMLQRIYILFYSIDRRILVITFVNGKSKIGKSVIGNVEYDLKQDIKIDKKSVLVLEVS